MYVPVSKSTDTQRKKEKEDRKDTSVEISFVSNTHPNGKLYAKETSKNKRQKRKEQDKKECPEKPRRKDLDDDFLTHVGTDTIFCLHPVSFGRQIISKGCEGTLVPARTKTVE
jgi:hypothetical protein